jgi:hypothetical protein
MRRPLSGVKRKRQHIQKNALGKKIDGQKSLIPLPPTGFASVFCANPDVVQTNL